MLLSQLVVLQANYKRMTKQPQLMDVWVDCKDEKVLVNDLIGLYHFQCLFIQIGLPALVGNTLAAHQ